MGNFHADAVRLAQLFGIKDGSPADCQQLPSPSDGNQSEAVIFQPDHKAFCLNFKQNCSFVKLEHCFLKSFYPSKLLFDATFVLLQA